MKKIAPVLVLAVVIGFLGSCKPKEKCPAYGKYQPKHAAHSRS